MTPATRTLAWLRQFAKLWGFALFCVFVVYIFREVALPFLFAILVAYILAPLVDRFSRLRVGGRPFPRGGRGHHPLHQHPRGTGAVHRLLRPEALGRLRAPVSRGAAAVRRSTRTGCRGPGPGSTRTSAPRPSPARGATTARPALERAAGRRARSSSSRSPKGATGSISTRSTLEVRPTRGGRFVISPPAPETADTPAGGKWERSIKQWIAERLKSTEGESQRALEYGQKFVGAIVAGIGRLFLVLMVAAFILVDLVRIQGVPALARARAVPGRLRPDRGRHRPRAVGRDPRPARHLLHQRRPHLRRAVALPREVPAAAGGHRGGDEPDPDLRIDPVVGARSSPSRSSRRGASISSRG